MTRKLFLSVLIIGSILLLGWKGMDEGMWIPGALPIHTMQSKGLLLSAQEIFDPTEPSLKDAIVLLGGGTGSYVSSDGLILTNHHVAYSGIRSISTVENDYLRNGFRASGREEELPLKGMTAQVVKNIVDVTEEIKSGIDDTLDAQARHDSIAANSKEVEQRFRDETGLEAKVVEMYYGLKHYVFLSEKLLDVRLVYAPPNSIGSYGGEVDNWMWPRHTGDFAILRAYTAPDGKPAPYSEENVPYHPVKYLPISTKGVKENSFVMVLGFPGRTYRWRSSHSLGLAFEETYPFTVDLYGIRIETLKRRAMRDRSVALKLASKLRGLENAYKFYVGLIEGNKKYRLLEWKKSQEKALSAYIASDAELQERYGTVLSDIRDAYEEVWTFNKKQRLLRNITSASDMHRIANRFIGFARKKADQKPSEEELNEMKEFVRGAHDRADLESEKEIVAELLIKALEFPAHQKLSVVGEVVNGKSGKKRVEAIREFVKNLYKKSKLVTVSGCDKLMKSKSSKILNDRFTRFASQLQTENREISQKSNQFSVRIAQLREKLAEVKAQWQGQLGYPDANRTLRLTFGRVRDLVPRDAVHYDWVTTLSGVMEKETGEEPFEVPKRLRELWERRDFGSYYDPDIGDVPVCFLADTDVTGGNSGSPILNARGELVGVVFDGNWEGVIGDFRFDPPLNRTINVESRYVLWLLDKFARADTILEELEIR